MNHRLLIAVVQLAFTFALAPGWLLAAADPCESLVPALVGGPMPSENSDLAVVRWLGNANYEVAVGGKVYLFDTYYDRVARSRPLGFTVADVKKADVIFLSHGHFDHMADIVPVAQQTGARVVGSAITIETAVKLGLPREQSVIAKDGDSLSFGSVTAKIGLARHATIQDGLVDAYARVYLTESRPNTAEEDAHTKAVRARGTFSPDVIDKGTLAFALVLRNGFTIVDLGSAGPVTSGDRALAAQLGQVDVAMIAYQPHAVAERQLADTWPLVELFHPRLYLPSHHDHSFGTWLDLGVEPLFTKLRDDLPQTRFVAPLYRSPVCVATSGPRRASIVKFRY